MKEIDDLSVIELTVDLPKYGLKKGEQGYVYQVREDGTGFQVEFYNKNGKPNDRIDALVGRRQCKESTVDTLVF